MKATPISNTAEELPKGWTRTTVGEIAARVQYGTSAKTGSDSEGVPVIRMGNIADGRLVVDKLKYLPKDHKEFPELLLAKGDVLFNRTNSAELVGKTAVYQGNPSPCSFASYLIRVRLDRCYRPELLSHYINSCFGRAWVASVVSQQVGQANVNGSKLQALSVPVPPLPEQYRIVAEIDKEFTRLDAAIVALKRVRANLKRYRASVLRTACEGHLVPTEAELARAEGRAYEPGELLLERILKERRSKWEAEELSKMKAQGRAPASDNWKSRYRQPLTPDAGVLLQLAEGWVWASVESVSTKVVDGVHKKPIYVSHGIPFVTVRNLTAGPGISFENLNHITPGDHLDFVKRANPEKGDLLVSKDGTLGVIREIKTNVEFSIFVSVALVKPVLLGMSGYLGVALSSPQVQIQMVPKGSGLQHIHLEDLRADCIPLPPRAEQHRIVAEVERRLSVINELEALIAANLKRAERLRQSILKRAFEGKLVPQHSKDEPASVLLARIHAERNAKSQQ